MGVVDHVVNVQGVRAELSYTSIKLFSDYSMWSHRHAEVEDIRQLIIKELTLHYINLLELITGLVVIYIGAMVLTTGFIIADISAVYEEFECLGNESRLMDCPFREYKFRGSCLDSQDYVGVRCGM